MQACVSRCPVLLSDNEPGKCRGGSNSKTIVLWLVPRSTQDLPKWAVLATGVELPLPNAVLHSHSRSPDPSRKALKSRCGCHLAYRRPRMTAITGHRLGALHAQALYFALDFARIICELVHSYSRLCHYISQIYPLPA